MNGLEPPNRELHKNDVIIHRILGTLYAVAKIEGGKVYLIDPYGEEKPMTLKTSATQKGRAFWDIFRFAWNAVDEEWAQKKEA